MDENLMRQLFAELLDANEQAFAVMAAATADAIGPAFGPALRAALARAQAAQSHPTRDMLLSTALRAAEARRG